MIKAALLDFDGTLVHHDILTELCGLNDKAADSHALMEKFFRGESNGVTSLVERINLLRGLSLNDISGLIRRNPYLMPGAPELFEFFRQHHITSIINSGTPLPALQIYQEILGADYVIGPAPKMVEGRIAGLTEADLPPYPFKIKLVQNKLKELGIKPHETIAIGDSPADTPIFDFTGYAICINPTHGAESHADAVINDDLRQAIPLLEQRLLESHAS